MFIVYALVAGHPASIPCEHFLRSQTGWFTTSLVLLEARSVLVKVYGMSGPEVNGKLAQIAAGPVTVHDISAPLALSTLELADEMGLDLTDAALLLTAQSQKAELIATDDARLAKACHAKSVRVDSPVIEPLRQQIVEWEATHLAAKGLPRILHSIHHWLGSQNPSVAEAFWSRTGRGSHLP